MHTARSLLPLLAICACVSHKPSPIEYALEHAPPVAMPKVLTVQDAPAAASPTDVTATADGATEPTLATAPVDATPTIQVGDHNDKIEVPPPPFSDGIFPCSDCHDGQQTNFKRRVLTEEHKNIVFEHDADHRWCLDCHNPDNRDKLRLASGVLVPFEQSYRLCGQCHGDKYRDWKLGIHGRRSGNWNGAKTYLLCVHCHNPHSPKFKPLQPKPAPRRPGK